MKPADPTNISSWWVNVPKRYITCLMCFLCLMMAYVMRFCLSIAITEMVVHRRKDPHRDPYSCPDPLANSTSSVDKPVGEFDWSEETQGLILSSFFWGYVVSQMPGGQVSERLGGKAVLGWGLFISSLGTLFTPLAARTSSAALIATRIFIGLGQGLIYPSLHCITAQWIPTSERGRLGCFVFVGVNFGNMVSMTLSGVLLGRYTGDWPIVFYLYGSLGMVWVLAWYFLGYSSPRQHPALNKEETVLLEQYLAEVNNTVAGRRTPWRAVLTSVPVWGLVVGQIGHDWGLFTIVTDLPKYMKSVMNFTITQNGLLLGLPYLLMVLVAISSGWLVDSILRKQYLSITTARKLFTTLASIGPAVGILGATYSGCDRTFATGFFVLGIGLMGFFYPSLKVNALDLSPNFAGTISALVIGLGAISGMITPYLVGLLTPESTLLEWRVVFWIAVGVLLLTNAVYLVTGSGEVQPWNNPDSSDPEQPSTEPQQNEKQDGKDDEEEYSSIPL